MNKNGNCNYTLLLETLQDFIKMRTSLDRLMTPVTQAYGLTPMQSAILNLIKQSEKPTISTLFRSFELNQGNMSSMCKKLESDGFIVKTRSQDDERCTYLSLTPKGEETIAAINSVLSYKDDECWLTKEEMKEAENAIAVIRRTLGIINEKFAEEFEGDREKDA